MSSLSPLPPNAVTESITGILHYRTPTTATLEEVRGGESLLVVDRPPFGQFDHNDAATAVSLFRDFLGRREGQQITLLGFRTQAQGRPVILVVRT